MNKVVVSTCKEYDLSVVKQSLKDMLNELEKEKKILKEGLNVVIKPNLISPRNPSEAVTTHPVLIEAIVQLCLERKCKLKIVESPSGKMDEVSMKATYQKCGIKEVAQKYDVELNYSSESKEIFVNQQKVEVLKDFVEADLIINCCKLKTHSYTAFTGAVKNMFGTIPGLIKAEYHAKFSKKEAFSEFIASLASSFNHQLCIMDGIVGMHKEGPTNGEPIWIERLLMSENPYALDEVAMQLVHINSELAPVQKAALRQKLWNKENLKIVKMDDTALDINTNFEVPENLKGLFGLALQAVSLKSFVASYPKVNHDKCIGCQECIKDCPASTIKFINNKANIDKKKCIRCYCCQEVCPVGAITIKN